MLLGPSRGLGVQRAFDVVTLVGDHLSDLDDQIEQALAGAPMVADADLLRVDVRVKDRREHPAKRRPARVIEAELDLGSMPRPSGKAVGGIGNEPRYFELD